MIEEYKLLKITILALIEIAAVFVLAFVLTDGFNFSRYKEQKNNTKEK